MFPSHLTFGSAREDHGVQEISMLKLVRISSALAAMSVMGGVCYAQSVTSAHSGTLHYSEGEVSIDGTPVQSKVGKFAEVKEQGVLSTALGRAEVLLTPGVFLRLGEHSSIKMLDTRLVSTRVDILSGNVILESDDPQMDLKDSPVVVLYKGYEIRIQKHGLIELNSDPGQLKVFKGEALVELASGSGVNNRAVVKEGKMLPFSAALLTEKFDDKVGDDLYLWARDRSQVMSAANMSSARSLSSSFGSGYGTGYGMLSPGMGSWTGGWYFNPFFGMYTFVPLNGALLSPFGYGFFSPATIYGYYSPASYYWYGSGGPVGASAGGRPVLSGIGTSNGKPAPIGQLLNGNSGRLATTGSPMRGGAAVGGQQGLTAPSMSALNGGDTFSSRGGGAVSAAAAPSSGGGSSSGVGSGAAMHGGGGRR
jgi:hypothetical protein